MTTGQTQKTGLTGSAAFTVYVSFYRIHVLYMDICLFYCSIHIF